MRISLTIFALAALCFGQDAFAQAAPKEVIVVDGQINVNSMPEVMLQGATNPIPVVDTSSEGEPFIHTFSSPAPDLSNGITAVYRPSRSMKLKGISIS